MGLFLDKPKKDKECESGEGNGLRYAMCSMQGWRVEMEDAHSIRLHASPNMKNVSYFAVFDGHAGGFVSKYSAENLLDSILEVSDTLRRNHDAGGPGKSESDNSKGGSISRSMNAANSSNGTVELNIGDFKSQIVKGFLELDKKIRGHPKFLSGEERSGSTAVAAFITEDKIIFANCGDSRALLCSKNYIFATQDHKPYHEGEKARIEKAGGSVIIQRVNGSLAVSRALGDYDYKNVTSLPPTEQLVSAEPEITFQERSLYDEFLILACDGVWDVMTNEEVVSYIRSRLMVHQDLQQVCNELLETCLAKGSRDNMSVVLVTFSAAPTVTEEALQSEAQLDKRIKTRVAELVQKHDKDISLSTVLCEMQEENIEGLPPGGGLQAKLCLIEETLDELSPNRVKDDGPGMLSSRPLPLSMMRHVASEPEPMHDDGVLTAMERGSK